jgi:catechol-2,3-dioxygenase
VASHQVGVGRVDAHQHSLRSVGIEQRCGTDNRVIKQIGLEVSDQAGAATIPAHNVIAPAKLAHFVIRTPRYAASVAWWKTVLGAQVRHENDFLTFLTYDDEHHRLAILFNPRLTENDRSAAGLEHVAFTYDDLDALLSTYERLLSEGISPIAPIHHGMTLSMYYADPDGNQVELQVDAMTSHEATSFMAGDIFAANPIGVDFDPADLVARRRAGASVESLMEYVPA